MRAYGNVALAGNERFGLVLVVWESVEFGVIGIGTECIDQIYDNNETTHQSSI